MFIVQLYGTILGKCLFRLCDGRIRILTARPSAGAIVNYVVMVSVVTAQREILLDPIGTNVWSGQTVQSLNSNAVTWALAADLYGPKGPYFLIPMSLLIGVGGTVLQWAIAKVCPCSVPSSAISILCILLTSLLFFVYSGGSTSALSRSRTSCFRSSTCSLHGCVPASTRRSRRPSYSASSRSSGCVSITRAGTRSTTISWVVLLMVVRKW
jgi:hypothetical protein